MPIIFIADDDLEMRRLLGVTLRRAGFEVELAESGSRLIERLDAARALDREPDLIISDIRMRDMNGLEALRRIRKAAPSVPVILITAFGDARTHERARGLGADVILDKPFDVRLLQREIEWLLGTAGRDASRAPRRLLHGVST
jgi:DNA-binding response OmpR family regulator